MITIIKKICVVCGGKERGVVFGYAGAHPSYGQSGGTRGCCISGAGLAPEWNDPVPSQLSPDLGLKRGLIVCIANEYHFATNKNLIFTK